MSKTLISRPWTIAAAALVLAASALLVENRAEAATPRAYQLICKAGGSMRLHHEHGDLGEGHLRIRFAKASAGASTRAPRAGECAWADRGMRASEPELMVYRLPWGERFRTTFLCGSGGCRYGRTIGEGSAGARTSAYLMKAIRDSEAFYVQVYNCTNDAKGCWEGVKEEHFVITRIGP